jgi:tripartite-type tricarboxylate transporter receptor subunit TctC
MSIARRQFLLLAAGVGALPALPSMAQAPAYPSRPALTDLLGGQVQIVFGSIPSSLGYIKSGSLRPLAVTTTTRAETLPDVPPLADFVPGYEMSTRYGIGAPAKTPAAIVDKLNAEINAVLADPTFRARAADLGGTMLGGSPSTLAQLVAEESEKWARWSNSPGSHRSDLPIVRGRANSSTMPQRPRPSAALAVSSDRRRRTCSRH